MNPRVLLALWRARWSKPGVSREVPYLYGKVNKWGAEIIAAAVWSLPSASAVALLAGLLLLVVLCATSLSLTNQMQFSFGILVVSLFIRRYSGLFVTLILATLALVTSSRYLVWRFGSTLDTSLNSDFFLGFFLCSAELIVCITVAVEILRALWPQYRAAVPLIAAPERWPRVDVFLLLAELSSAEAESLVDQAVAIDWPRKRKLLYLIDDRERIELRDLAAARGARYLVNSTTPRSKAADVNHALPLTRGEFIAVFDGQQPIERTSLRTTLGWFVRDLRLGMLLSPKHFTAPPPTPLALAQFDPSAPSPTFALFRRSMLTRVAGLTVDNGPKDTEAELHTALKLRAAGFRSAYVGMSWLQTAPQSTLVKQTIPSPLTVTLASSLIRVNDPFSERTLRLKQRLADIGAMLAFYAVIPKTVFLLAPLFFLLGGANPIQTSPELFVAYALPHLLQGAIARSRLRGATRFSVEVDLREGLLSFYLMLRTTLRLIRPGLASLKKVRLFLFSRSNETLEWASVVWFGTVMLLNLIALGVGLYVGLGVRLDVGLSVSLTEASIQQSTVALYVFWCAWNVMHLAALLAVGEEARSVREYHQQIKLMPAMLKLPSGRTISCITRNFPKEILELTLPDSVNIDVDATVMLSLFSGQREYVFAAHALALHASRLTVVIDDGARSAFSVFGSACLSRGIDWPQWLPSEHADRLLPVWLSRFVINSLIAILDFFTHFGQHTNRLRPAHWLFTWKQKK